MTRRNGTRRNGTRWLAFAATAAAVALVGSHRATATDAAAKAAAKPAAAVAAAPIPIDRSYAVVVSDVTYADPAWRKVVDALVAKHDGKVVRYAGGVADSLDSLRAADPRYACFVATPAECKRSFVVAVHRLTRHLNDDPYGDVVWGIVTGYTPADALRVASVAKPLVIRKAGAGTSIDLEKFDGGGEWFSEAKPGEYTTEAAGRTPDRHTDGPADSTKAIVDFLNAGSPDLFVTSGHASERNWALGYKYKNGQFRVRDGQMSGVDLAKHWYPVHSDNPKVFFAIGNCLMGHVDQPDCMALGWIGSGGVDQFVGYTVVTWYPKSMGWRVYNYLFDQPGQYDVAESFFFANQTVLHDLATEFPKSLALDVDLPDDDKGKPDAGIDHVQAELDAKGGDVPDRRKQDNLGLMWDRDTVVFYGDPLWDARLAPHGPLVTTAVTRDAGGTYHLTVAAAGPVRLTKPLGVLLPQRVRNVRDVATVAGGDLKPLVTGNFAMLFGLKAVEPGKAYEVTFRAEPATPPAVAVR